MKKTLLMFVAVSLIIMPAFMISALPVSAQSAADSMLWGGYESNVQAATGLGNTDPREMAGSVLNVLLGFLGVIAVLLILFGGFKWMTAAGDESKIDSAKKIIGAGVVGLVIILAAFGIAQFVISALHDATGATL